MQPPDEEELLELAIAASYSRDNMRIAKDGRQNSARLPDATDPSSQSPFRLNWESDDLGMRVVVEEAAGEIIATVHSTQDSAGVQRAVIGIVSKEDDEKLVRLTVTLDPRPTGDPVRASAQTKMSTLTALRQEFGSEEIFLIVFRC